MTEDREFAESAKSPIKPAPAEISETVRVVYRYQSEPTNSLVALQLGDQEPTKSLHLFADTRFAKG